MVEVAPDNSLKDFAREFSVVKSTISRAFQKLKITRKKNHFIQGARRRKAQGVSG